MASKKKAVKVDSTGFNGNLYDYFSDSVSKDPDLKTIVDAKTKMFFPTKLDLLDYKMGKWVEMQGDSGSDYLSIGPNEGSLITIVGDSGSGKSTLAVQLACNIVAPYDPQMAWVDHFDEEEATTIERVCMLHPDWDLEDAEQYYHLKDSGLSVEKFYLYLDHICKIKSQLAEKIMQESDKYTDRFGVPLSFLPPTVVILDSLAVLQPENVIEKNELGTSMSTTSTAKSFATLFRSMRRLLRKGNIFVLVVNHLLDNVSINQYETKRAPVNYLPANKTVYGGKTPVYLSNFVLLIEPGTKLKSDESFGFDGFLNTLTIVKNRSNKSGQKLAMVFSQEMGFSNELTNYIYLKNEAKLIGGAGVSFYLKELPDIKFSQKKFLKTIKTNKEFRKKFKRTIKELYTDFVFVRNTDDEDGSEEE